MMTSDQLVTMVPVRLLNFWMPQVRFNPKIVQAINSILKISAHDRRPCR